MKKVLGIGALVLAGAVGTGAFIRGCSPTAVEQPTFHDSGVAEVHEDATTEAQAQPIGPGAINPGCIPPNCPQGDRPRPFPDPTVMQQYDGSTATAQPNQGNTNPGCIPPNCPQGDQPRPQPDPTNVMQLPDGSTVVAAPNRGNTTYAFTRLREQAIDGRKTEA